MARTSSWRHVNTDACSWHQDEALSTTIYILRQTGPTGFLLKQEGEAKKFKVFLGDPHSCTCSVFLKEKDLCKHICWVLLRKFRVPRDDPMTWQLGLVEREINEVLHGKATRQSQPVKRLKLPSATESNEEHTVEQRPIDNEDVCPICQEELLAKHLPVTYCKFSCGNSIHIKCMKVWAEHQKNSKPQDAAIKCPVCREDFGPFSLLQQECRNTDRANRAPASKEHLGVKCNKCSVCPIVGKCYKCVTCAEFFLCQSCFITPTHTNHSFQFRERTTQRWREAAHRGSFGALPGAMANQLMNRDITDADYDMLLQLDSTAAQQPSQLSDSSIKSLPQERIRHNSPLLHPGVQCCICLRGYQVEQYVRRLPCRHKFHRECIDNWLLHQHATCPIDGTTYSDASIRNIRQTDRDRKQHQDRGSAHSAPQERHASDQPGSSHSSLMVPGIGVARIQLQPNSNRNVNSVGNNGAKRRVNPSVISNGQTHRILIAERDQGQGVGDGEIFSGTLLMSRIQNRRKSLESVLNDIRQQEANESADVTPQREANGRTNSAVNSGHHHGTEPLNEDVTNGYQPSAIDNAVESVALVNTPSHHFLASRQSAHRQCTDRHTLPPSDLTFHSEAQTPDSATSSTQQRRDSHTSNARSLLQRGHWYETPSNSDPTPPQNHMDLFVGHNPSMIPGLVREYGSSSANRRRNSSLRNKSHGQGNNQSEVTRQRGSDEDLTLAGSALSGLTLKDLVTKT